MIDLYEHVTQETKQYSNPIGTPLLSPNFDLDAVSKRLERELSFGSVSDFTRPDKSFLVKPREEENQMWDDWYTRRLNEISSQETRFRDLVNDAVEHGQLDSLEANKALFGLSSNFGTFGRLRRDASDAYSSGRKF